MTLSASSQSLVPAEPAFPLCLRKKEEVVWPTSLPPLEVRHAYPPSGFLGHGCTNGGNRQTERTTLVPTLSPRESRRTRFFFFFGASFHLMNTRTIRAARLQTRSHSADAEFFICRARRPSVLYFRSRAPELFRLGNTEETSQAWYKLDLLGEL